MWKSLITVKITLQHEIPKQKTDKFLDLIDLDHYKNHYENHSMKMTTKISLSNEITKQKNDQFLDLIDPKTIHSTVSSLQGGEDA